MKFVSNRFKRYWESFYFATYFNNALLLFNQQGEAIYEK